MNHTTLTETYTLPSQGKIYDVEVTPKFTIRAMTTEEELKRTSPTDTPYTAMSNIIEKCLETPLEIPVSELCLGDYQYLLHRLRVVTYGEEYPLAIKCPICGSPSEEVIDLDKIEVFEYSDDLKDLKELTLPVCGKVVKLKLQTPKLLDEINLKKTEILSKSKNLEIDPTFLITLALMIDSVDGKKLSYVEAEQFVRKLYMKDANIIIQTQNKLNESIGVSPEVSCKCKKCGCNILIPFRITSEFFGPRVYR